MRLTGFIYSLNLLATDCLLFVCVLVFAAVRSIAVCPIMLLFGEDVVVFAARAGTVRSASTPTAAAWEIHTDAKPCAVKHMPLISCRSQVVFTNNPKKMGCKNS